MPKNRSAPRKRRSLHEIATLMEEFRASKMSVAQFARRIGVSVPSVYQWKRRLREELAPQRSGAPSFASMVRIIPTADPAAPFPGEGKRDAGVSLVFCSGLVCRVESDFHEQTLLRLLQLLSH